MGYPIQDFIQLQGNAGEGGNSNTWIKMTFNSTLLGTLAGADLLNNRFTAQTDGLFQAVAYGQFPNFANGNRHIRIHIGDSAPAQPNIPPAIEEGTAESASPANTPIDLNVESQIFNLTAGQHITLWFWQNSGGFQTVNPESWLEVRKVG